MNGDMERLLEESNPNAGGKDQLAGDMGVSSERVVPEGGVEGTGTEGNARTGTNGTLVTDADVDVEVVDEKDQGAAARNESSNGPAVS